MDLRSARRRARRRRAQGVRDDERRLFLVCLALPPILVFTLTPLWGARGLPHWPMPGWFFAFPLLGAWLGEPWARALRPQALGDRLGGVDGARSRPSLFRKPRRVGSRASSGCPPARPTRRWKRSTGAQLARGAGAAARSRLRRRDENGWRPARSRVALGPRRPVLVFSDDPRGMAFLDDSARFVGRERSSSFPQHRLEQTLAQLAAYFAGFDPPQSFALGRGGRDEIALALVPAHGLTRAFPVPYPH